MKESNFEIKYVCWSGYVLSKDNQEHYISARKLPRLYNVNPKECLFINRNDPSRAIGYSEKEMSELIQLSPRSDGNYTL